MNDYNDNEEPGFFRRYRIVFGAGIAVVVVAAVAISVFFALSIHSAPPRKPQEIVVHLEPPPPLPPPPPPPPPPKEPPPEQKMVEQPPVNKPEEKPKETPKAPDRPPSLPGPVASGPPSDFGLGGSGGGGIGGGGGGGGSKYGWYAGEVQKAVAEALRKNPKTHDASLHVKVRIWSDTAGRVTRALLAESSGDSSLDDAVKNQVLTGLILPEAPPTDMPMPIVLRLNAQRPN